MMSYSVLIQEKLKGKTDREKYEYLESLLSPQASNWKLEILWFWGKDCRFRETTTHGFFGTKPNEKQIEDVIKDVFTKICKNYTYDCGNKKRPLYPAISSVTLTPELQTESIDFSTLSLNEISQSFL